MSKVLHTVLHTGADWKADWKETIRPFVKRNELTWLADYTSPGGHVMQVYHKGDKIVAIQFYAKEMGFDIWRPVSDSHQTQDTIEAAEAYLKGEK